MPIAPRVFISYARDDGEVYAQDLRERLTAIDIPLWQDRVGMEGGRDWWTQIAEALNHVEFLVLVMTPAALRSSTVRREWREARRQGVCVYPVKTDTPLDYQSLPRWMRSSHFYDLTREWPKFVNDLNTRCQVPRVPFMTDDIPADFVQRPRELDQLISALRAPEAGGSGARVAALCGIGGAGKSILARALCHDDDIQETFDQGVLWVTLGERLEAHDLAERLQDLVETLTGSRPGFAGLDSASARFSELIADRRLLIVIDDVWNEQHAKPFLRGGLQCGRLLTTRNVNTVPAGAATVAVDTMNVDESLAVLQSGLGDIDGQARAQLRTLARRVGQWVLILKLVNGVLRARLTSLRQPLPQAIAYVTGALQRRGLVAFDERNPVHPHQAVGSTLEVSFEQLTDTELARFRELAVFPEDADIPLAILARYWGATGHLDEFDTEELCVRLHQLSLLANLNLTVRTVRLHDIVRMYLVSAATLTQLHKYLIEAHRPASGVWAELALDLVYMWDYLAYHLVAAGLADELVSTVLDLRYLSRKTFVRRSAAAERDLVVALQNRPADPELEHLLKAFMQSAVLLNKSPSDADVAATLFSRVQHLPALARLRPAFLGALHRPCFVPMLPPADLPHPALLRTLSPPTEDVERCAATWDGSTVAAMCGLHLVVWDAERGVERARIKVPDRFGAIGEGSIDWDTLLDPLRRLPRFGMAADGSVVVTASLDPRSSALAGALVVWDGLTGESLRSIPNVCRGGCAVNGDASLVLTVGVHRSLELWDLNANVIRFDFDCPSTREKPISCLALSDNGELAVAGIANDLMAFRSTGRDAVWVLKHSGKVTSCAISADGTTIVSGTETNEFRVWSAEHGDCRYEFNHGETVNECAVSGDGSLALSLSHYGALKLWDLRTGTERTTLQADHPTPAYGCALSRDGAIAVSTVSDGTIQIWDARSTRQPLMPEGRNSHACAAGGETVLVLDNERGLEVWDGATGTYRLTLHSGARSAWITRDGQTVAAAADGVRVWNLATPEAPVLTFEQDEACALSADGSCLVLGAESGNLRALRPPAGGSVVELTGSKGSEMAVSADGLLIIAQADDGTAKVWDARTGVPGVTLAGDFADVLSLVVSTDKTFAAASRKDGSITTHDLSSGRQLLVLPGNEEWVRGCSITGDSRFLASARADGSLTLWDVRSGERLCMLHVKGFLFDCSWFGDDQRIVAAGTRGAYFLRLLNAGVSHG